MKKSILLVLLTILIMSLCACSKDPEPESQGSNRDPKETESTEPGTNDGQKDNTDNNSTDLQSTVTPGAENSPLTSDIVDFDAVADLFEQRISEAVAQYEKEDYTRLSEPVKYNVLWLGYTHVTFGDLDFRMTDFDKEYLKAVTLNFEKTVERLTDHNLDIMIDLYFVDDETELTQWPGDTWLYLAQETVQQDIDKYDTEKKYDTVLTAVETAGDENVERNTGKAGYGTNYVMLGLKTAGVENGIGYSTFELGKPRAGTYPLADPEIPSLYATAVSVHEWMHQLEYLGKYLGIEYPDTHAYQGNTPGYQAYTADLNNYDFFEFYELVLAGKLPYTSNNTVKHVGMYPKMWPLAKRGVALDEIGTFTITNANGEYLSADVTTRALSISKDESKWQIRYGGKNRFILLCDEDPSLRVDLGNAWDMEGNSISVWIYTGYDDAQSWLLYQNFDGTYYIRTPYSSGRALAVDSIGSGAYLTENGTKWTIEKIS